jgi:hypothetical protein
MTYKNNDEVVRAFMMTGHSITEKSWNRCVIDNHYTISFGMRIHVLRFEGLTIYFDSVVISPDKTLAILWRGGSQVCEIAPRRTTA